jgi:hypothetical protein
MVGSKILSGTVYDLILAHPRVPHRDTDLANFTIAEAHDLGYEVR